MNERKLMHRNVSSHIEDLERRLAEAKAFRKTLEKLPETDDFEAETVLFFRKQFNDSDQFVRNQPCSQSYAFVALKVECKGWYLSGGRYGGQPMSWCQLVEFLSTGVDLDDVWVVSAWDQAFQDG